MRFWSELGCFIGPSSCSLLRAAICYADRGRRRLWSTSTTSRPLLSRPLLLQSSGFKQGCSAETKAMRRQLSLLTIRRRWMQEEVDFDTLKDLDVFSNFGEYFCKGLCFRKSTTDHELMCSWMISKIENIAKNREYLNIFLCER